MSLTGDQLACFKKYDIRGILGESIDENTVFQVVRAFGEVLNAKKVVLGFDSRASSPSLAEAAATALTKSGVNVLDIGMCGTEEVYWATTEFQACGGIQITASHNPINYNGIKFVKEKSAPLDPQVDLEKIKETVKNKNFGTSNQKGEKINKIDEAKEKYCKKILSFVDVSRLKPLKILVNAGNGTLGPTFDFLENILHAPNKIFNFTKVLFNPDPTFPNGIPNPLIKENQKDTSMLTRNSSSNLGLAFDGDFDRCFFFDESGRFVPGEIIVSLLAEIFLKKNSNAKIVHDNRVVWSIIETISKGGGIPIQSQTGHSFVKQKMRENRAVYGGELSAHHYFRDFAFCDSGMIPWLLICERLSQDDKELSKLVDEKLKKYPSSGEINFSSPDPKKLLEIVYNHFENKFHETDDTDGLTCVFQNWRFNLRASNTEPLIRLNLEAVEDNGLLEDKKEAISNIIYKNGGKVI